MPIAKFALYAFDTPPWETSNEKVIIGLSSWILSCDPEIPSQIVEPKEVTVKWPVNEYDNYLKFARKGNTQDFEFTELSAKLLYKSGDDRDLLLRKANYLKHGSIVTPEHSSRRINAAKNFEDCEFSKRAASQSKPCSSQADPELSSEGPDDVELHVSENETLEDDDPVAAAQAKELELLNQFAEGNGISPIGREKNGLGSQKNSRRKLLKKRSRKISSSSDESEVDPLEHIEISDEDEDAECTPRKQRLMTKLAKQGKRADKVRINSLLAERKLLMEKDKLTQELLDHQKKLLKDSRAMPKVPNKKVKSNGETVARRKSSSFERLWTPVALEKDESGDNYVLGPDVFIPVKTLNIILRAPTCGRFVTKLMEALLTKDELSSMSKTGGSCTANSKRSVQAKMGIPLNISNAIINATVRNYNVNEQEVLKKIGNKLANSDRKEYEA